jgi:hypothetical protein
MAGNLLRGKVKIQVQKTIGSASGLSLEVEGKEKTVAFNEDKSTL